MKYTIIINGDTCSYLFGEPLGEYQKIETINTQYIYFGLSGHQELHYV